MELNVNQAILNEHPNSKALISLLKENEDKLGLVDSIVYFSFPLYMDNDNKTHRTDVLLISKFHGIIIFKCVERLGRVLTPQDLQKSADDLGQIHSLIFSKLIKSKILRSSSVVLSFEIKTALFLHELTNFNLSLTVEWGETTIIKEFSDMHKMLDSMVLETPLKGNFFKEIVSILEGAKGIIRAPERIIKDSTKETKGHILALIESEIATFDIDQKKAALKIIDGPQRIRGLAGSGKTIVLAMKAAQLHLDQPNARIVYTYWTKNLYDFVKRLITRFYRQFAEKDPDWTKIQIMHAWGGKNLEGVYHTLCVENNKKFYSYGDVRQFGTDSFDNVCKNLDSSDLKKSFDYIILDEAQDFPIYFYRICYKATKNGRVIWGYDECQNILNIELQDTIKTFGKDTNGKALVDFSSSTQEGQDIVLHRCYRNPLTILVTAFALGFGIYSDKILQMLENKEHWEDLGFKIVKGEYKKGEEMEIIRPEENSPLLKNQLLVNEFNPTNWKIFDKLDEECDFVSENTLKDLQNGLLPQDIAVICLDDYSAKFYFSKLEKLLHEKEILTFNLSTAPSNTTKFFVEGHVTLSTVYRAKGNEAGSVYIIGIDHIYNNSYSVSQRNKIFVAITRAKSWVTITGVGESAKIFEKEIKKIVDNNYALRFIMPDMKELKVFQRDLVQRQAASNKIEKFVDQMSKSFGIDKNLLIKDLINQLGK